jgi:hypothetical protein
MDLLYAVADGPVARLSHIFAMIGMAMPVMMVAAEIASAYPSSGIPGPGQAVGRGTAILFAVGPVSGTVLSFELGLVWPAFMEFAGPMIGMPFSLEGFAFSSKPSSSACTCTVGQAQFAGRRVCWRDGVARRCTVRWYLDGLLRRGGAETFVVMTFSVRAMPTRF